MNKMNSKTSGSIRVNSLGEGAVLISNLSGSLENGDYITTCEVPGYCGKQNDGLLHTYTVAKITTLFSAIQSLASSNIFSSNEFFICYSLN